MKKFYSLILMLGFALAAVAAPQAQTVTRPQKAEKAIARSSATYTLLDGDPIYNPAGEVHSYVMNYSEVGVWGDYNYKGLKFSMCFDADGKTVYLNTLTPEYNFMSSGDDMSWVKGTISGNDITVPAGQMLAADPDSDDAFYMLVGSLTDNNNMQYEDEIHFTIADDGSISIAEQCADWRIVVYQVGGEKAGIWAILYNMSMTPYTPEADIQPSAGVETATYVMSNNSEKRIVDIAFEDDKCYIKGVFTNYPNDWIMGTISGNTLTIAANQLFTHDPIYYGRLGIGKENGYDSNWNTVYERSDNATFTISDDHNTIVAVDPELMFLENDFAGTYTYSSMYNLVFTRFDLKPVQPAMPSVLGYDDDPGYETLIINIPSESVDGEFINTEWLTYSLLLDGQLYTFKASDYAGLSSDMTEIPYDFNDSSYWEITSSKDVKRISMKTLDWQEVGVFSTYTVDGVSKNSEIARFAGVQSITVDNENAPVQYFNMQGMRISNPMPGQMVIKRQGDKATKLIIK